MVMAEEERVLGDNVFQDYCFRVIRNWGIFFCTGFVCQFLISVGMEFPADYQKNKRKEKKIQ